MNFKKICLIGESDTRVVSVNIKHRGREVAHLLCFREIAGTANLAPDICYTDSCMVVLSHLKQISE